MNRLSKRRGLLGLIGTAGFAASVARAQTETKLAAIAQPAKAEPAEFIRRANQLRADALARGDQGYGAVVVKDGRIVGQSGSQVVTRNDPTAHAELEAVRDAARRLGSRDLSGCVLYGNATPCSMCMAGAYWAGISRYVVGDELREGGAPRLC